MQIEDNKYLSYISTLTTDYFNWQKYGNCFKTPRGTMYPSRQDAQEKVAQKYCVSCPVKLDCLYLALVAKEEFGVWGGTSENERAKLQTQIVKIGHTKFKETWSNDIQNDIYHIAKNVITQQSNINEKHLLEAQV